MPSISQHFPFSALLRRRSPRPARPSAPPEPPRAAAPATAPVPLPMLAPIPEPDLHWAEPHPAPLLREQVAVLEAERALASLHGLDRDGAYAEDLQAELAAAKAAYIGTAVVELAVLRAELNGRLQG